MTYWRLITQELADAGGTLKCERLGDRLCLSPSHMNTWLRHVQTMGLVERAPTYGYWQITALGRDWLAGKVKQVATRPGGRRWVATWLRALPEPMRL